VNHAVWWDADLLREIEDSNWISKWDWNTGTLVRLLTADGAASNNGTKANAALTADLFGDWREEVIWRAADNNALRIYSTIVAATNRMYTLMHDPQYRAAVAWQNVGYNQPPHPGFYLGVGMGPQPRPRIVHRDSEAPVFKTLRASSTSIWPPNHQMVPISIDAELVDLLDASPAALIVSVSSNEPVDGDDDGQTSPDWEITGPLSLNLRAERSGLGVGRVYTIVVEGTDSAGNAVRNRVEVSVPLTRAAGQ
jgi:hypothetical protein